MPHERHLNRWDDIILRIIAVYHLLKAAFFFALGLVFLHFVHRDISQFLNDHVIEPLQEPLNFDSDKPYVQNLLEYVSGFTPHFKRFVSYLFFFYSFIFIIEGVGLYLRKRWAEYMVVIVVTSLLPIECYEIYKSIVWWKIAIMIGNLLVIGFLIRQLVVGKPKH